MTSWSEFSMQAPIFADVGHRLLVGADGVAIAFLAVLDSKRGRPLLAPVCPIFCAPGLYLSAGAHTPKASALRASGAYVLHAFLGANDEEFQIADDVERAAVHRAIRFGSFDVNDPIFQFSIKRALWVSWERVGQPGTKPVRRRWIANSPT